MITILGDIVIGGIALWALLGIIFKVCDRLQSADDVHPYLRRPTKWQRRWHRRATSANPPI
jgi:hypothetical protein